jgi:hypothetical protein
MKSIVLAGAVVLALLPGAALADGGRLTGLPAVLLGGAAAEGTQHILPQPPVTAVSAGGTSVVLGQTPLQDVATALGGTIASASDGSEQAAWLCYTSKIGGQPSYVWFVANGTTAADGKVNLVGGNFVSAGKGEQPCGTPKSSLDSIDFSVPGLGASEADLQNRFGTVSARYGYVAYTNQDGSSLDNLNYLIQGGVVTGIAATRIGAP